MLRLFQHKIRVKIPSIMFEGPEFYNSGVIEDTKALDELLKKHGLPESNKTVTVTAKELDDMENKMYRVACAIFERTEYEWQSVDIIADPHDRKTDLWLYCSAIRLADMY